MRFSRRFRRSLVRFVLAGAFAATVWVPIAAASNVVEKGGQLVPASQASSIAAQPQTVLHPVARYTANGDVVVGSRVVSTPSTGRIIGPVGTPTPATAAASTSGFDWRDTGIGIASAFAAAFLLAAVYLVRRRTRLTPA